ncbi:tbcb-1 [Pristionchus pacificus]|uniref:Tbcb-1 n=1 Tax=Pristionchus pacificus TaxID=54126 RepID=A0A2A6CRT1_PRIPA|nr:tbcb-1 [Pristionchus pacificus]|eukprot:PDM80924.1 tbcb-1 [Pristionchus pacificus]
MSEVLSLEITSNATEFPYEKKFPSTITLLDLKKKLELVVGSLAETMKVDLRNSEGNFVSSLTDDAKTLGALGVKSGMHLYVVDSSGANEELKDASMIEKYEMNDKEYDKRENSVRAWKKKILEEKGETEGTVKVDNAEAKAAEGIKVDCRCEIRVAGQMTRRGRVAFVGETKFKEGIWVGVHYDEPVGKNDGSVQGVRYFECMDKYGGFVRPTNVTVGDFPELGIDDDMDEI